MQRTEGDAGGADGLVGGAGDVEDVGVGEAPALDSVVDLRLPRYNEDWATAHTYFLAYPPLPPRISDLNSATPLYHVVQSLVCIVGV